MGVYLPMGPQHPLHPEATLVKLRVEGEHVVDADVDASFVHRGIEKALEHKTYTQGLYLAERICGICNVAHTTCYTTNVESLAGIETPYRALYLRLAVEELARIHSHLLWLGLFAHTMGFETLFMLAFRDREPVLDLMEEITGGRVTTGYNVIGGVRRDVDPGLVFKIKGVLTQLKERILKYKELFESDPVIQARTRGVGYLSKNEAGELLAVGPVARASAIARDVRIDDPYLTHEEVPFNVIVYDTCDAWGRAMVRLDEILESINMVQYTLDHLPSGEVRVKVPPFFRPPPGEMSSRVEAPRGSLLHYVKSDGSDRPVRYRVRTPTLANLASVVTMLRSRNGKIVHIADVPVIFSSIDPCICCTARVTIFDERGHVLEKPLNELLDMRRGR